MSRGPGAASEARARHDPEVMRERWTDEETTHAAKLCRAQAIAIPRVAPVPEPVTEWIVAGLAVVLLLAGLFS